MEKYKKLIEKQREYITYLMKLIRMNNIVWDISIGARGNYESEIYDIEKEIKEEPDQDLPSDEEIEASAKEFQHDTSTSFNQGMYSGYIFGALDVRNGNIKSYRK